MTSRLINTTPWTSKNLDTSFGSSRRSLPRGILVILAFGILGYLLVFLICLFFSVLRGLISPHTYPSVLKPGDDAIKHFTGSWECGISHSNIYHSPMPASPENGSPFCKNRATLLEALSSGGRHGYDQPYVGSGCTYRWFSSTEICMIMERFNAIVFLGDDVVQTIYAAFNILLREDLVLGSLQHSLMGQEEQYDCKCDNQFLDLGCLQYAIKASGDIQSNAIGSEGGSSYFCERIPHAYIPFNSVPSSAKSQIDFQNLTYSKPNPWQPSPMIVSFSHGSSLDTNAASLAIEEWTTIAKAAKRNIPMLFLGPPAFGRNKTTTALPKGDNLVVCEFQNEMTRIARRNHFDILNLYNLTVQASSIDGVRYGEGVALVEAMMVVNWLSKLDTA